jgi:hypothetical protein
MTKTINLTDEKLKGVPLSIFLAFFVAKLCGKKTVSKLWLEVVTSYNEEIVEKALIELEKNGLVERTGDDQKSYSLG